MPTVPTGVPTVAVVTAYLDEAGVSYNAGTLPDVIAAEVDEQMGRCRFPRDAGGVAYYPPALVEALKRRVAHNLAVRPLPLGVQATVTDVNALNVFVGGLDAEAARFEKRWRKVGLG